MEEKLEQIIASAKNEIETISNLTVLGDIKAKYLGKKSELNSLMSELKNLTREEKAEFGVKLNETKGIISDLIDAKRLKIENEAILKRITEETIDITKPSHNYKKGSKHLINIVADEVTEFFLNLGFKVAEGPEVELDHYNFELLNIPKDHPAREMQDSFFIDINRLLRSHTSPVQAHTMEEAKGQGPIKVICPGKTYRRDEDDATHSHQFSQIEGLFIDKDINLGHLLAFLEALLKKLFGEKREVRFRPSYFPFTEPSVEADVSCFECGGKGCSICKNTGWIEILGGGMVHPNVLKLNGFDPEVYQGFAFGIGIERIALLKYGVDDIRKLFTNDARFAKQFDKE